MSIKIFRGPLHQYLAQHDPFQTALDEKLNCEKWIGWTRYKDVPVGAQFNHYGEPFLKESYFRMVRFDQNAQRVDMDRICSPVKPLPPNTWVNW